MKIVVLTTDTKHHTYFINQVSKIADETFVIYETRQLIKPYVIGPFFDEEQDSFEEKFFEETSKELPENIKKNIKTYKSCNDPECVSYLKKTKPDVIITFGTGFLKPEAYAMSNICSLNIHRGYIADYRGLDSDLWAIYNKEFNKIGVAIHHLAEALDTGAVIKQDVIKTENKFEIFHIRYLTTVLATSIMKKILLDIKKTGSPPESTLQKNIGKYYSAMQVGKKMKAKQNLDNYFRKKSPAVILLYHGVTSSESRGIENFSRKHIAAEDFAAQMRYVKENLNPVSLRELTRILNQEEKIPPGLVAVTFDDSFKNVHDVALPILEETGVPATFFITTGMVGTSKRYWVDRLEHMINHSKAKKVQVNLDDTKKYYIDTEKRKIECVVDIKRFLKTASPKVRERVLEDIKTETSSTKPMTAANYQNLSWEDVQRLDESPLCEVGGHTVNHEILSYLDDKALDYEVGQCINDLEKHLSHKIDLFSYPEGQEEHYNQKVIDKLKENGVNISPSAINGVNNLGADAFNLRRIMVDFMGMEFPYEMKEGKYVFKSREDNV